MSYDLMVFDAATAPHDRGAFMAWYDKETKWSEGHSYDDPANTSPALRAWYDAIRKSFPNMNGPGASQDPDNPKVTDYSIGRHIIYAAFRWTEAENAYPVVRSLAVKYGVGFYDVSGDEGHGEIHFPSQRLEPPSGGAWRDVAKQFRDLDSHH